MTLGLIFSSLELDFTNTYNKMVMLRRCNEWEPVSGDPGNLRGLYSCLFSFKMRVSEVVKIIQYNYQQNIKNELVRVSESASLLALNIDFKIWFGAC